LEASDLRLAFWWAYCHKLQIYDGKMGIVNNCWNNLMVTFQGLAKLVRIENKWSAGDNADLLNLCVLKKNLVCLSVRPFRESDGGYFPDMCYWARGSALVYERVFNAGCSGFS